MILEFRGHGGGGGRGVGHFEISKGKEEEVKMYSVQVTCNWCMDVFDT